MSYDGLILDFGGVVTTDFYGALAAFSVREGLEARAFVRVLRETTEGHAALAAVECGQISQRDYERVIGRLLGLHDRGLLARALADLRPRQEVVDLVRRVRDKGVRVAALSNSWGTGDYDPYDGYELGELFDAVVISDQVGLRKPSLAIYELTALKIGLPPDDCLFVDDTEANLPPARPRARHGNTVLQGSRRRDRRNRTAHRHRLIRTATLTRGEGHTAMRQAYAHQPGNDRAAPNAANPVPG